MPSLWSHFSQPAFLKFFWVRLEVLRRPEIWFKSLLNLIVLKEPYYIILWNFRSEPWEWWCRRLPPFCSPFSIWCFAQVFFLIFINWHYLTDCSSGFICQFREFRGAGISPEAFLSMRDWLGSEEIRCELCFSVEMKHISFLDFWGITWEELPARLSYIHCFQ